MKKALVALITCSNFAIAAANNEFENEISATRTKAEQGDANSQHHMGRLYDRGMQNYKEAVAWYTLAAKQGHTEALLDLGTLYHQGQGVPVDTKKAAQFFGLAASLATAAQKKAEDDAKATIAAAAAAKKKAEDDAKAAIATAAAAQKKAEDDAKTTTTETTDKNAQYTKAREYLAVDNHEKAVAHYIIAANLGHIGAQVHLGNSYAYGKNGVDQNIESGIYYTRLAANQGSAKAQYKLGIFYEQGLGVRKDTRHAMTLYHQAANQGYVKAIYRLAVNYRLGIGRAKNYEQYMRYYRQAAALGHERSIFFLEQRDAEISAEENRALPVKIAKAFGTVLSRLIWDPDTTIR